MSSYISLKNISYCPEGKSILSDICLDLSAQRIGVIGLNGSGKSSLARVISGLVKASSGELLVHGTDPYTDRISAITNIGMIFQNPDRQIIFPTVAEEIAFGLKQLKWEEDTINERVQAILERFNVADWGPHNVYEMSDGQRHLVCLMAVLVMEPKTIIFDEPYSGLDLVTSTRLHRLIKSLEENLVLISHDLDNVSDFDQIIWLEKGKVQKVAPPDTVLPLYKAFIDREINRA